MASHRMPGTGVWREAEKKIWFEENYREVHKKSLKEMKDVDNIKLILFEMQSISDSSEVSILSDITLLYECLSISTIWPERKERK